jgi:hypothetical protein
MEMQIAAELMQEVSPEADRLSLDRHMGPMMAACDEHLFRPILSHYPELAPHR